VSSVPEKEYRLYLQPVGSARLTRLSAGDCIGGIYVNFLDNGQTPQFLLEPGNTPCAEGGVESLRINDELIPINESALIEHGTRVQIGATSYTVIVQRHERVENPTLPRRPAALDNALRDAKTPVALTISLFGRCAAAIHQGRRANQEDFIAFEAEPDTDHLWVIADGVGGETQGDVASEHAARWALWRYYQLMPQKTTDAKLDSSARLTTAFDEAHQQLVAYGKHLHKDKKSSEPYQLVTTTLTAAALRENRWTIAQVGNSSAYLFRPFTGEMRELTTHTHVMENDILRYAVGNPGAFEVEINEQPAQVGDLVLLCTDGLTQYVSYEELQNFLFKATMNDPTWDQLPARLIALVKERGEADNVAIIVIKAFDQPQARNTSMTNPRISVSSQQAPPPLFSAKNTSNIRNLFKRK